MYDEGSWEKIWKSERELNFFGKKLRKEQFKSIKKILKNMDLSKHSRIIDIGCGEGLTLSFFKKYGFENIIGIDVSKSSIDLCRKRGYNIGKDIFLMDGSNTKFKNKEFDLVFSDGLLEHFKDFEPFIKEWCRISRKYVLITQPNHFSFWSRLVRVLSEPEVYEYTYTIKDFENVFNKYGFRLIKKLNYNWKEQWTLLFLRK